MTHADSKLHESYEHAPGPLRRLTDECWEAVRQTMIANGFRIIGDDCAEILVAHLYEYVIQCPPIKVAKPWTPRAAEEAL